MTEDPPPPPHMTRPMSGFRRAVGYQSKTFSAGFGEVSLTIDESHWNLQDIVHGGVYATLLDAAIGHAVAYVGKPGRIRRAVTINLQVTYMAPAKSGVLIAKGFLLGVNGRIATCRGEVWLDETTLCATGVATYQYRPGSEGPDGVAIETKPKP